MRPNLVKLGFAATLTVCIHCAIQLLYSIFVYCFNLQLFSINNSTKITAFELDRWDDSVLSPFEWSIWRGLMALFNNVTEQIVTFHQTTKNKTSMFRISKLRFIIFDARLLNWERKIWNHPQNSSLQQNWNWSTQMHAKLYFQPNWTRMKLYRGTSTKCKVAAPRHTNKINMVKSLVSSSLVNRCSWRESNRNWKHYERSWLSLTEKA